MYKKDRLKDKISNFQTKASKRPFENTANYQNSMRQNRLDPRVFSVYKILEDPKLNPLAFDEIIYVDFDYVDDNYIVTYDKFNPPGDPL